MNLEDFVSETLMQIMRGVQKAQDEIKGGFVAPTQTPQSFAILGGVEAKPVGDPILASTKVDFDVAVSGETSGSLSGEAKGGIKVVAFLEGKAEIDHSRGHYHRIRFSIPLNFPSK